MIKPFITIRSGDDIFNCLCIRIGKFVPIGICLGNQWYIVVCNICIGIWYDDGGW